jgi:hypothetical protein
MTVNLFQTLIWIAGFLLLVVPATVTPKTIARFEKGTLIVFTRTQDGILVCADKRLTYDVGGHHDDGRKLAQIGPNIVFAVGGVPSIEVTDGYGYDAMTVVKDYFARNEFDNSVPFWNGVKQKLFDNFIAHLRPRAYNAWPPTLFPEAEHSFTQLLFFFTDDSHRLLIKLMQLRYMKQEPPIVEVRLFTIEPYGLYDSLGWSKLDWELKKGHDSRFDDLRQEPELKPFLTNKLPAAMVTVDAALVFTKRLIEVSNKRGPELGVSSEDIGIGLTCDCALVTPTSGVRWIAENLNVEK